MSKPKESPKAGQPATPAPPAQSPVPVKPVQPPAATPPAPVPVQVAATTPAPPEPKQAQEKPEQVAEAPKVPPVVASQLKADSDRREMLRNRICAECLLPYPGPPAHSVGVMHNGRCPKCGSASFMVSVTE